MRRKRNIRNRHLILILSIILLTIFSKSWREIPKFYRNMVYVSSMNAIYYIICKRHLVWEFVPTGISWMFIRMVHILIITPLIVLVFLSKMPSTLFMQCIHFVKWIIISTAVEYFIHKKHLILYAHGWNVFWSGIIYAKMFLYSHLFTKRPKSIFLLSFFSMTFFIIKFKVPLKIKHISKNFEPLVDMYYHTKGGILFTKRFFGKKRLF